MSRNVSIALLAALVSIGACKSKDTDGKAPVAKPVSGGNSAPAKAGKHIKQVLGECTFELDAPEDLKEAKNKLGGFTLESDLFSFEGYEGQELHSAPQAPTDMDKGEYKDLYRGTANGVQLAITEPVKPNPEVEPRYVIAGTGAEPFADGRSLGCTFSCSGAPSRKDDVLEMCKSVRITVKPADKEAENN